MASEFLKLNEILEAVRAYSRLVRTLALVIVVPLLLLSARELKHWPEQWPTTAPWLNVLIALAGTLIVFFVVLIEPDQEATLQDLPETVPVVTESLRYFKLKKNLAKGRKDLIREIENTQILGGTLRLSEEQRQKCAGSSWDLDRTVLYLFERHKLKPGLELRMRHIENEKDVLDRNDWTGTRVPLHYAIKSVKAAVEEEKQSLTKPQCDVIQSILSKLNTTTAKVSRVFGREPRGEGIMTNCREILKNSCTR